MAEIAEILNCSVNKVRYWMDKSEIPRRPISEAVYIKYNPDGDPFKFEAPRTLEEAQLFGLGIGLYWGEGTKANKNAVRLGNSDPVLIKSFMDFLVRIFSVDKSSLKFELQIFDDVDIREVERKWIEELDISEKQMYKTRVTPRRGVGTYRKRNTNGVMTVSYGNTKLRNRLVEMLPM